METALDLCLVAPHASPPCESVSDWWPAHRALAARWSRPADLAMASGFSADRAAWAFAGAYQACLRALAGGVPDDRVGAFCVTEDGGNRPKDVLTRIEDDGAGGWIVTGSKRWALLGPADGLLLVAGRVGEGPRPDIRIVRIRTEAPGVRIDRMPPTRFVPEAPHARVAFDAVRLPADAMLPGDGHERYVKPMRTLEDTLVTAALLAYLVREARTRDWPRDWIAGTVGTLAGLSAIAARDPADPVTHVALAGVLDAAGRAFDEAGRHWDAGPQDAAAERWRRDAVLAGMAGPVRAQRLARAWERLSERT